MKTAAPATIAAPVRMRSHQIGCASCLRAVAEVARQRDEFAGHLAQPGFGKARRNPLLQSLGGIDDQQRVERPVVRLDSGAGCPPSAQPGALGREP